MTCGACGNMEVMRSAAGKPTISLTGGARGYSLKKKVSSFHVSLTHDADRATAVVLAVR